MSGKNSYFHDFVFVFVTSITNIKAAHMKNPAGRRGCQVKTLIFMIFNLYLSLSYQISKLQI